MDALDLSFFKSMNIYAIFQLNEDHLVEFFTSIGLFFDGKCPSCNNIMSKWNDASKDYSCQKWYCKSCSFKYSNRYGTIFESMKIRFVNFNQILYYYTQGFTTENIYSLFTSVSYTKPN